MAKISVIVPIYGVEKYLREALDSILNQTLTDLEIILIDDGSKDNCSQIIDEYASKDNRIVAIYKHNGGYGQTMNVGLEHATGEYIAVLEPDDYIKPKMYEDLYNIAKQYNSDIVKSCYYDNLQAKDKKRIKKIKWKDYIPKNKSFTIKEYPYFLYYHPSIWSCVYKREFLNKHNISFVEVAGAGWTDNPFQVQTMCLAQKINYTSNAYYYWRRVNIKKSDDLKDYTIPFKRTEEIHKWLEENNIKDNNILFQLYKREIAYIRIVLGIKDIIKNQDCLDKIAELINNMNEDIILKSGNKKIIKQYKTLKNNPKNFYWEIYRKNVSRDLIKFRWNKHKKRVVLFGKNILRRINE